MRTVPIKKVKILFAGDFCPRGRTEQEIVSGCSKKILSGILPVLEDKDLSIVNMEAALTNADTPILKDSGPNIKVDPACAGFLPEARFDVAALANNHACDFGPAALMETIRRIKKQGARVVGAGKNLAAATAPLYLKKNGVKIAVLNFAENEFGMAEADRAGFSPLDPLSNVENIRVAARKVGRAGIVIVIIHGGNEHNPVPSPRMVKTYRAFIDVGASAVIAAHPHCPQGYEFWNGKPIVYSMGNFLFDWSGTDYKSFWWIGYMVKIVFSPGEGGKAGKLEIIPYTFAPDGCRIRLLEGKKKEKFMKYIKAISGIIKNSSESKLFWDAWCAMKGPVFINNCLNGVKWPLKGKKQLKQAMKMRNIFVCEAHNEVMNNFLRMVEKGRVRKVEKYIPKIRKLQKT
ncbi:MAG: hypothetical protein A2297_01580 [Elusimicrobia bacterium RIFOXYB2_FULL_48_7]|nr:MAG: hypothetical protein A2297_01580 [Elusimicrobia bacterium RIFOXYB2_FULL_48_7]